MLAQISPPIVRRINQELANSKLTLTQLINDLLTEALDYRQARADYRTNVEQRFGR